jgi:hypothetical protein
VFLLSPPQDAWIISNIGYDCDSSSSEVTPWMLLISCHSSLVRCLALMCYKVSSSSSSWPNNETDLSGVCTSCFGLQNSLCQHPQAKNLDSFHITFMCQEFRPHCLTTTPVSRMDSESTPTFWMHYLWFCTTHLLLYPFTAFTNCTSFAATSFNRMWHLSDLACTLSLAEKWCLTPITKKLTKTTVNTKQTSQYPGWHTNLVPPE